MPALHAALAVTFATVALAALAPRPVRRPPPRTLLMMLAAQPLSLVVGLLLWPLVGAHTTAMVGMTGVSCMMLAVWLLPREDPWHGPSDDDDGGHGGDPSGDDGPGGLDWAEFDRAREQWATQPARGRPLIL